MSKQKESQPKSYKDKNIDKNAQSVGYKTANLMKLQDIATSTIENSDIKIQVPSFEGLTNEMISAHLKSKIPSFTKNWEVFTNTFQNQEDQASLGTEAKQKLADIRTELEKSFSTSSKAQTVLEQKLLELNDFQDNSMLMVRSTGREDSVELANPGGNESYPCQYSRGDNKLIQTISAVVASYFSEKSIAQRLASNDDITQPPFMPVLLQTMVGEKENSLVYSGVAFTCDGATRMQVAPGHGELVVNSRGNTDSFYVDSENMIYSATAQKDQRMKAEFNESTGKMELDFVDNTPEERYASSLDEEAALAVHEMVMNIEQEYGMRMDVEFVYNPSEKTISLVQARAIPPGKRKGIEPSAIAPEFLKEVSKEKKLKGNSVTPDIDYAITIDNPNQIAIFDNIGSALDEHLHGAKKSSLKACIIKEKAPTTSHEAGELNAHGIAVLQMDDLTRVKKMEEQLADKSLVIDTQRQIVVQLDGKEVGEEIIETGVFKSALSPHVTAKKQGLLEPKGQKIAAKIEGKYGDLVRAAKQNPEKSQQLMSYLYQHLIDNTAPNINNMQQLEEQLDVASNISGNLDANKQAVKSVSTFMARLAKKEMISKDVLQTFMLSAGEFMHNLQQVERLEAGSEERKKATKKALNTFQKFEGLVMAKKEKGVLGNSMMQDLAERKHEKEVADYSKDLNEEQKEQFMQLAKLKDSFLNPNTSEKYLKFCAQIVKDKEMGPKNNSC